MNKEEKKARELCAKCNWIDGCIDCLQREQKECKEWVIYLDDPLLTLGALLCKIGLHKWYKFKTQDMKKCMRCRIERPITHFNQYDWILFWKYLHGRLI